MESQRTLFIAALLVVSYLLWSAWNQEHQVAESVKPSVTNQQLVVNNGKQVSETGGSSSGVPQISQTNQPTTTSPSAPIATSKASDLINITTDVMTVTVDLHGGDIVGVKLLKYPNSLTDKAPVQLLTTNQENFYVANSGILGAVGPDSNNKRALYTVNKDNFYLGDDDQLQVDLHWKSNSGVQVTKSLVFNRDSYVTLVKYNITNNSQKIWQGSLFATLQRKDDPHKSGGMFSTHTFQGAAYYSNQQKFVKLSPSNIEKLQTGSNYHNLGNWDKGWVSMVQHYFLGAWIPLSDQNFTYQVGSLANNIYRISLVGSSIQINPGQSQTTQLRLYSGPEINNRLVKVAPGLNRTIDYGILWPIAILILWLLQHINSVIGNWGWSIVIVTFLIKLLFYKLSATSYKSMAKLRKLQPQINLLRERHANDKQKLSQEMMALYKKEKANPFGGCLPIVVQIPVFISLYWVLIESVELRQAPFMLWIHDLSVRDPYFILPIIMGLTMWLQQKMSPAPADPAQAKLMLMMPIAFTALFLYFPSGLVLYWVVNNTLSILQQWWITKKVEQSNNRK